MKKLDITIGQKFNMLTIIEELPIINHHRAFKCKCDCGNTKRVLLGHLVRSKIKSCGCHRRTVLTKHGMHNSREYSTWENMIQRCRNPKARKYYLYGGCGITVCESWNKSFQNFYQDMGLRPDNTSLDRIDSNKGYYKENCKWSTPLEQLVNVRTFTQYIKHNDITMTLENWLTKLNFDRELFKSRVLRGHSFKEVLFSKIDIIVLTISNKKQDIYPLQQFLIEKQFEKEKILKLLDEDHEEPYLGYLLRYLTGFSKWPDKYV